MEKKHTPGPWNAKEYVCHAATTIIAADGTPIAETTGFGRMADDCLADACLIAAAPELMEALFAFVEFAERHGEVVFSGGGALAIDAMNACTGMARAAIAKATANT